MNDLSILVGTLRFLSLIERSTNSLDRCLAGKAGKANRVRCSNHYVLPEHRFKCLRFWCLLYGRQRDVNTGVNNHRRADFVVNFGAGFFLHCLWLFAGVSDGCKQPGPIPFGAVVLD